MEDEEQLRRAELLARYRGALDPADVVLWRANPDALGADGSRSPVARAAELGPLIYGRADTPERMRERDAAAAEAHTLLAGWAAASAALDDSRVGPGASPEADLDLGAPSARRVGRSATRPRPALLIGAGAVALAVLVAVAVLLQPRGSTNAAPSPLPSLTSTPSYSPRPTDAPTSAPTIQAPPPSVVVAPPVVITPPPEDVDYRLDYYDQDIMSVLQVPINGGPIDNANGVADVDPYGVPLSYVVASGDVFELIAKRFDIGTSYLASINMVRRDNPTELFVGDTINLGATTILRIGDQNGVVYNFTDRLPEPHLPQD